MSKKKVFELPYLDGDYEKTGEYDVFYTENGDISITISLTNPVIQYSGSPDSYNAFHNLYSNIIKVLGEGYILQKQDVLARKKYVGTEAKEYLQQKYNDHFEGREYVDILTYLTITKSAAKSFFTYDKNASKQFNQNISKIYDILVTAKTKPKVLNKLETELFIKRILTMNFSDDQIVYNSMKSSPTEVDFGDKLVRSLSLVDIDNIELPNKISTYIEMSSPEAVKGFPTDLFNFLLKVPNFKTILYNQVITLPNQQRELLKLDQKRKRHSGIPDAANFVCVNDIEALLADVAKNSQVVVRAHYNVLICAEKQHIDRACNFVISSLFQHGISPSKNAYNQLELFRCALPGNANELGVYDWFLTTSDAALCLLFKEALAVDEVSNFTIKFTDRQGVPIAIDPADLPMSQNRISNRNKFVLGPSGSGKSFLMNSIIEQYMLYNMDIVIVDTGHSYSGLCSYFNGRYITYSETNPITMNPFAISKEEFNIEKRDFLGTLIVLLWKNADGSASGVERDMISNVINSYYSSYFDGYGGLSVRVEENIKKEVQIGIDDTDIWNLVNNHIGYIIEKQNKYALSFGLKINSSDHEIPEGIYSAIEKYFFRRFFNDEFSQRCEMEFLKHDELKRKEFNDNKISHLSFDSFYKYAIYKIPSSLDEENGNGKDSINFNFIEFRYVLRKFCSGEEFGETLNQKVDDSLFSERFIVFEIDSIKEHKILFPIVTLIIMDVFIQKMRNREQFRKALIIEEAWKAIASPLMAGYILYLYKTVRKFWGEAIVVTQELGDIIGNAVVKDSIISNSDTICLLDQSNFKDNYQEIASLLSINEIERRKIFTINKLENTENRGRFKEVYIRRGSEGEVYGVEVSFYQYLAYTTEKPEKLAITVYVKHYLNYQQALEAFVIDFKSSNLSLNNFVVHINRKRSLYSLQNTEHSLLLA
jgi:type IV secretory pathway VirB4 component